MPRWRRHSFPLHVKKSTSQVSVFNVYYRRTTEASSLPLLLSFPSSFPDDCAHRPTARLLWYGELQASTAHLADSHDAVRMRERSRRVYRKHGE